MSSNTTLNPGVGGDVLKTDDSGAGYKIPASKIVTGAAGSDGGYVTAANPFPTQPQSGSIVGLLVGGVPVSQANPIPTFPQSGTVGLFVGGVALSRANPLPVSGSVGIVVNTAPVTIQNPLPMVIASGSNTVGLFSFHNADNQSLGSTVVGLNVGGVAQLLNVTGNLDRQRSTGQDTIPAIGIATSANQYASPFTVVGTSPATGSQVTNISASLSGTNRGAPWGIQPGTVLQIGSFGDPLFEIVYVTAINTVGQTFSAGFKNTHVAPFAITGAVYNQGRDATVADGATGQGFQAGATYLLNNSLNGGAGGWEGERSAAGELDNASGRGTAVAAEYMWTGIGFDRTRNVTGKGYGLGSLQTAVVSGTATVVPGVVPVGLAPGSPVLLYGGLDTPEVVYTTSSYVGGTSPILLAVGTNFAHSSASNIVWDRFSAFGPGLGPVTAFGVGIDEEVVYSPVQSASFLERAADSDGIQPWNVVAEASMLWNGTGFDRMQGQTGSIYELPRAEAGGQILSGTVLRTVQYATVDAGSGSVQVVAPQGAGNVIRVLSVKALSTGAGTFKFVSTSSAGLTNIDGYASVAANGGYVLPHNPHGWFQTKANDALNISVNIPGTNVGISITWIIAGP